MNGILLKTFLSIIIFGFGIFGSSQDTWWKLSEFDNANSVILMDEGMNHSVYGKTIDGWIYRTSEDLNAWIPFQNIPDGAGINIIRSSETQTRVYATTSTWGLLYTDNFGANWGIQNFGLNSPSTGLVPPISNLEIQDSKVMACFTSFLPNGEPDVKIYFSADGAANYQFTGTLNALMYESRFTGNNREIITATNKGIFHKSDITSGNWQLIGFSGQDVINLEFKDQKIYAAVFDGTKSSVFSSSDLGNNWNEIQEIPFMEIISELKFDAENQILYVSSEEGVFKWQNNNWNQLNEISNAEAIAVSSNGKTMFSGRRILGTKLYDSSSNQTNSVSEGLKLNFKDAVFSNDDQLYLSSNFSNILSKYDLNSFNWESQPVPPGQPEFLVIHSLNKSNEGQCLIGMNGFLVETENSGNQFHIIGDNSSAPIDPVYGIFNALETYSNNKGIYVRQHSIQKTLNFTPDRGQNWEIIDPLSGGFDFFLIDQILANGESVYFLGRTASNQNTLIQTQDNGTSWHEIDLSGITAQKIFADQNDNLFIYSNSDKLFRMNESGQNWTEIPLNLGNNPNKNLEVVFDNENRLYVLFSGTLEPIENEGIYRENLDGSFEFIAFPNENGTIPMQELSFNSENIPFAISNLTNGNEASGVYYFHDEEILSTENLTDNSKFEIYPNPVQNELFVQSNNIKISNVVIFDAMSRAIFSDYSENKINVKNYPSGIYFIKVYLENGEVFSKKFIIQK